MAVDTLRSDITEFLYHEAELLDEWRLREWLSLVTEDIRYQVPIRITKEQGDEPGITGVSDKMFHMDEDFHSLEMRVERVETGFAWAEDPPSRLRHFISNVRVSENTEQPEEVNARSNVLIYRSRWDKAMYDILSAERRDLLRRVDGEWKLSQRRVILDNTTLPTLNLSFFF